MIFQSGSLYSGHFGLFKIVLLQFVSPRLSIENTYIIVNSKLSSSSLRLRLEWQFQGSRRKGHLTLLVLSPPSIFLLRPSQAWGEEPTGSHLPTFLWPLPLLCGWLLLGPVGAGCFLALLIRLHPDAPLVLIVLCKLHGHLPTHSSLRRACSQLWSLSSAHPRKEDLRGQLSLPIWLCLCVPPRGAFFCPGLRNLTTSSDLFYSFLFF